MALRDTHAVGLTEIKNVLRLRTVKPIPDRDVSCSQKIATQGVDRTVCRSSRDEHTARLKRRGYLCWRIAGALPLHGHHRFSADPVETWFSIPERQLPPHRFVSSVS